MNINELVTGDILLINNKEEGIYNYFINMIKYSTHSVYDHVGIIVKDPQFTKKPLYGIYLWESGYEGILDPQDNKIKLGVQLTKIEDVIKNYKNATLYVRRLQNNNIFTYSKLKEIHEKVYNIPYDINIIDLLLAFFRIDLKPQKISRFWCSAFVGYVLTKCGVLKDETDWSIMYPCDFALDGEKLNYNGDNTLLPWEKRILQN